MATETHRERMAFRRIRQLERRSDYPQRVQRPDGKWITISLVPPSKSDSAAYRKPFVRDRLVGTFPVEGES